MEAKVVRHPGAQSWLSNQAMTLGLVMSVSHDHLFALFPHSLDVWVQALLTLLSVVNVC